MVNGSFFWNRMVGIVDDCACNILDFGYLGAKVEIMGLTGWF